MGKNKSNRNKRRRGLIGWLVVFLLTLLALVGLAVMTMSVLSSFVNPVRFVWLAYFGLLFWVIFLFNLVIFVLLMAMRSRWAWIAVLALLIAIPGIYKSFSTGKSQEGGDLSVMSYNVMNFKDQDDPDKTMLEVAGNVAQMVKTYQPDVLCLQEFAYYIPGKGQRHCITSFGELVGMPYQHYNDKSNFCSNVIFSKYPLRDIEEDHPLAKQNDYGTVALVDAGEKGTFTLLCCHLVSFQLTNAEITVFSNHDNSKEEMEEYGKSIVTKLKKAYEKRSLEVSKMLEDLPRDGRPIVMCGDFNDTPLSYTYHQIYQAGFTDGFVKAGRGIGYTYAGKLPLLRIDYIWGNDPIQPLYFKRLKHKGSDHYPVMMKFNVNHGL